ncbi:MAG: hypothetical protein HKN90_03995 [Flavobacteriaceae bacterium]|nr:hypothetical protein [Flavobacteriaceae bacterium]
MGGNSGKPVKITLSVRSEALYNANPQPSTQLELDAYCGLSDDNLGKIPPGGPQNINEFTSQVYNGNTVTWDGVSSDNPGYRILIDSISNNTSFFASDPPGQDGKVTATLKSGVASGTLDTYTITFSIDPPGNGTPKTYNLDPKLNMN